MGGRDNPLSRNIMEMALTCEQPLVNKLSANFRIHPREAISALQFPCPLS